MGGKFEWPAIPEVVEYRRRVRQLILNRIEATPLSLPITKDSPWVRQFSPFIVVLWRVLDTGGGPESDLAGRRTVHD